MKKLLFMLLSVVALFAIAGCENKEDPSKPDTEEQKPTPEQTLPYDENGALNGLFSVSKTTKIRFSRGSLQYNDVLKQWRFADEQYIALHMDNNNSKDEWFDRFGFATSGYDQKYPTMNYQNYYNYYSGMNDISSTGYDWGWYNKIYNGGNKTDYWRTLTKSEWQYLLIGRNDAYEKLGYARVNSIPGIILLPDEWNCTNDTLFVQFCKKGKNGLECVCKCKNYTLDEWKELEKHGAVFIHTTIGVFTWTSTPSNDKSVAYAFRLGNEISLGQQDLTCFQSVGRQTNNKVRLVTNY